VRFRIAPSVRDDLPARSDERDLARVPGGQARFAGRIQASGWIRGTGMHWIHPGTRIHADFGAGGEREAYLSGQAQPRLGGGRRLPPETGGAYRWCFAFVAV